MLTTSEHITKAQAYTLLNQIGSYYATVLDDIKDRPKTVGISQPHEVNSVALHGIHTAKAAGKALIYFNVMQVLEHATEGISKNALLAHMIFLASSGSVHGAVKIGAYYEGIIEAQQTTAKLIDAV